MLLGPVGLDLGGQLLLSLLPSDGVGAALGDRVLRGLQASGVTTVGFGKGLGLGGSGGDGSISLELRRVLTKHSSPVISSKHFAATLSM